MCDDKNSPLKDEEYDHEDDLINSEINRFDNEYIKKVL